MTTPAAPTRFTGAHNGQNSRSTENTAPAAASAATNPAERSGAADSRKIPASFTFHGVLEGFPFDVTVQGTADAQEIVKRLKALGATAPELPAAPAAPAAAPARKTAKRMAPMYDADGDPCCPVHRKPLIDGQHGLYCPSKADGEHANAKGYCNIRFSE